MAKYKVGDGLFYYDYREGDYGYGKVKEVNEDRNVFNEEIITYAFENDELNLIYEQHVYGSALELSIEFLSSMQRMEQEYNQKESDNEEY